MNGADPSGQYSISGNGWGFSSVYFNRTETKTLSNAGITSVIAGGLGGATVIAGTAAGLSAAAATFALSEIAFSLIVDAGIANAIGECAQANFVPGGYYPSFGSC